MGKSILRLWMDVVVKKYFIVGVLSLFAFSPIIFFPLTSYAAPASGTRYLLVIGVDYADRAATYTASQVQSLAFGTTNSVSHYYNNVSYSAITVSPAAESYGTATDGFIGWLRLSGNHPDPGQYDVTTRRTTQQQIAKNAILAADSYINFASYDTNGDGTVSSTELAILVIVAGYEGSIGYTQPSVYAEASNMSAVGYPSVDGITIEKYAEVGEIHTDHLATFGLMTHELGHHMFSLPDLYGSGTARGIGRFDLMANGNWGAASGEQQGSSPTHLSAWCKEYLSWGTVTTISSNQTVSFPKVDGNSASIFRINTADPNQYFLIENRQFSGYDIGFQVDTTASGHGGLVIYHVDTTKTSLYPNTANVNEDVNDKGVDVEEANQGSYGSSMLDTGFAEAHTNMFFFSGNNTSFSNTATPNSKLKNGNATNISITDISVYGDTMTATFIVPPIVSSTSPASGATSVAVNTTITATFSEAMDSSTITTSTFTLSGGVTGTVSYDSSTKTATFTPSSNLSYSTTYTATITTGVKDSAGNNMAVNYTWSFTTTPQFNITTVSSGGIGGYTSLALDSTGKAHISCYDWTNGDLKYATNSSGTWTTPTTVDSSGNVGEYTAIALDSSGKAYISYYDRTNNYLKYATKSSGTWTTETADSSGNVAGYTSIALDSSGNPYISYFDSTGLLKYATKSSGTWETEMADTNGGVGGFTSIALDSSGKAYISYYDWGNGDLKYTTKATGSWEPTTVDSAGNIGTSTSIALDSSRNAYISYYDGTNGNLMYATNASGWGTTTVDSSGDVGQYTSLALDSSRNAYISYYDATNGNLMYATNASGSWGTTTVDSSGDIGKYTSIKLDSSGKVHISYFDSTNGALKYAINDTIPPATSSTSPASGATGVSISATITATFNDAMDPLTMSASTFTLSSGGSAVSGTVSYNSSTKTATFTPSSNLSYSTTYTATITTSAKDSAGNSLASAYTWSFTTTSAPASEPPPKATLSVTSSSPSGGATSVGTNTVVTATFSDNMNGSTLTTDTFKLSGGGSNVTGSVSTNGNKATFTPSAGLAYNTTYTATITTGAQAANAAGTTLDSNYTWNFTTESAPVAATPSPTAIPAVISTPTSTPVTTPSLTPAPTATPSQPGSLWLSKEVAYLSGDTVAVTVVDTDRDTNSASEDTLTTAIKVAAVDYYTGNDLLLDLKETDVNSGTFLATIRTGTTTTGGAGLSTRSNIGTIKTTQGGTATVMYTDAIPNASTITKTLSFSSFDATLEFDAESHTVGSYAVIIHGDAEENEDSTKVETLLDHAFIETSPFNRTKVKFVETGVDTGTFKGSIQVSTSPSLGYARIQASAGEILTAWCEDGINTTGAPRVVSDRSWVAGSDTPIPTLTPAVTPQPVPTPETTPTPAECVAEKITLSSTRLKFKINQITEITVTVNGNNDCPVEGEMVETKITTGRKYVSVLPMSQETDNNGQAAFTITARKKPGNARVTFMLGGLRRSVTVQVAK